MARPGQVVVGRKLTTGPPYWEQEAWRPWELDAVLYDAAGKHDLYLTQNRFRDERKLIDELRELGAFYSDIDFYKVPELAGMAAEAVVEMALDRLELAGIPEPSLVIFSGQGIYLIWLHSPVGRSQLDRWNRCQKLIYNTLKPLGADSSSLDAARVLRLVGTKNRNNNGEEVRTLRGAEKARSFEELAGVMVPAFEELEEQQGADLYDLRIQRAARRTGKPGPNGWTVGTLWEARLSDLHTLRELRYGTGQMSDYRDRWLFIAGVAMSWLVLLPDVYERELLGLAEKAGGWDERRARNKLHAAVKRNLMYARGETVEWEGIEVDPRYRFKTETIQDWLEITAEEERHMSTLISTSEKYRRDLQKKEEARRKAGIADRAAAAQQRRAEVHKLRSQGHSQASIAEHLDISTRHVRRLLHAQAQQGRT